ncbi:MAG: hypothetical protein K2H09_07745, partial [Treponemataceae bacterium]|nr:hypothetical protein [Treponemataceae bacterium]
MDLSIDSFASVPILATVAAGLVLFILLILSKIRNTSKVSLVFYLVIGVNIAGLLYTYLNSQLIYLVLTLLISEGLLIVYAFVLAISDPKKRDEKKNKKPSEQALSEAESDAVARNAEKYNELIQVINDLTAKAAGFFNSEDALTAFLGYFNKLIIEKTE